MMASVKDLFEILKEKKATLGTAESCTGGLLAAEITSVSGSSEFFIGSIVSYANSVKQKFFNVTEEDLKIHGAVSQIVAEKMAIGVRHQLNCTFGISITGVAGPKGGSKEKPVGTVWLGVVGPNFVYSEKKLFSGDRQQIRKSSVECALHLLTEKIRQ
jgi:PncC family amidohydrolase